MSGWLVAGAWLLAVLFALVLFGFAGYELAWKTRRLNADKARLDQVVAELHGLTGQLQEAAERAGRLQDRSPR
ncbi:MAG TPA: hypothetical protein VHO01_05585 [Jatrophihabitans sp.]|nr:hypothetical protein [Jatrophihabitans sp.]